MRLTEGAHAPDFLRQDLDDTSIALGEYRGRHVLLSFYRFSTCPFCNLRVREVAAVTDDLIARGVYPLAVFHSSAQAMRKQLLGDPLPFPVLPDPGMSLYADYDVERSWAGVLRGMKRLGVLARAVLRGHLPTPSDWRVNGMPADILIGPDGAVVRAYYGRDMGDHLPLDTVFELVSADTDAAPVGRNRRRRIHEDPAVHPRR